MKKIDFNKIFTLLLSAAAGVLFFVLFASVQKERQKSICKGMDIYVNHSTGIFFVSNEEVAELLANSADPIVGKSIDSISLEMLERKIEANPFVTNAEVYLDMQNNLKVKVRQREPVLRIMNNNGVSYYLDENGEKMPVSTKFAARVPVATGFIQDNGQYHGKAETKSLNGLFAFVQYIRKSEFWSAQVEQIYINEKQEIEVTPRLGNHTIIFGNPDDLETKFDKLMLFYKEGLKNIGWYKYKTINLKYKDQIVCTKY